ncbi:MAG: tetratricopeptide repeat protein [Microcystaceae cyanobacterium]
MQKFLRQIKRWLQQFFGRLLGGTAVAAAYGDQSVAKTKELEALDDTDYEFLFSQLLEGIAHGWHEGRVLRFFEQLGDRGKTRLWLSWLDRFGQKVLSSPSPNLILAARMMRLGELCQSFAQLEPLGKQSNHIARELYARQAPDQTEEIWEYGGPDAEILDNGFNAAEVSPDGQQETYTLEELVAQLQTDPVLAEHLAAEFGLENPTPDQIIAAILEKFDVSQENLADQPLPETSEGWLERGLELANLGNLEEAIAAWDQALALDPNLPQVWHNRGSALGNLGRLEEALASFTQATTIQPENYQAWFSQGLVLESQGDNTAAIASYEKALAIETSFEPARERLNALISQN